MRQRFQVAWKVSIYPRNSFRQADIVWNSSISVLFYSIPGSFYSVSIKSDQKKKKEKEVVEMKDAVEQAGQSV